MKKNTLFFSALICVMLCLSFTTQAQESDFDNDGIIDRLDVDDDNDGIRDTVECPGISGALSPAGDAISWSKNGFDVFVIGNNTNGQGYRESGFQQEVYSRGQVLTVLIGASDYSFPATSFAPGTATTSVGTFANGTLDYEHNYTYRSTPVHQFRTTTSGGFTSGLGPSHGVYLYPEVGAQAGDYYTVNINFTEPVASFSLDFVDIFDTNYDSGVVNSYEIYADGNLVGYFRGEFLGDDGTGDLDLFDADGILKGTVTAGQNLEDTFGFVTHDPVSVVSIRHEVISGGQASATHEPHGLDTFAYSFLCQPPLDIDVDDDGIPDNIEGQPTIGYLAPSGVVNTSGANIGMYTNYGAGFMPENTDGTDLPDYLDTDTDNDGVLDINENGQANIVVSLDADNDGLDDNFDIDNITFDSNDEVTTGNIADLTSSFGVLDADASSGGDLDYRDANTEIIGSSTIDFDGEDDYLDTANFISDWTQATIMGWVKIENSSTGNLPNLYSIAGQENLRLYISSGRIPNFVLLTQQQVTSSSDYPSSNITVEPDVSLTIENDLWYHIAGVFDASTSTAKLYVNGELVGTETDSNLNSELLTQNFNGTPHIYSDREFTIGRYPTNTSVAGFGHLNGNIDEVRVFKKALTDDQLQSIVYQEIENNGGYLKGSVIDKDILDFVSMERIQWSALEAYYPMSNIVNGFTFDESNTTRNLRLNNITTVLSQTAPMPYQSTNDGAWTAESTWLHGDVWDIENLPNKDWSIVKIENEVTTSSSHTHLGLIIDAGEKLTVTGSNEINNTWYLDLDGIMDLQNESQLVQTEYSDLEVSSAGKILRRQEGLNNVYRYNYWSSPVGATSTSANNTDFSLNMLKDANGNIQFTTGYTPPATTPATLSTYWLYTYKNGVTYYEWVGLNENSPIEAGVGYSQKGTGVGSTDFQYIFEGKPNNGEILISVNDAGGTGSVGGVSKTEYLLGNPYPSALDVNEFILDNSSLINGAVYLWEQWAGESHILNDYEGGYATLNLSGGVRAYQFVGIDGGNTGSQDGIKTPERYIPVAQGFMTEIVGTGDIKFENDQRIFKTEASGESIFMRSTTTQDANENDLQKIRLEFSTTNDLNRELLLAFGSQTTDQFDYGYDAKATETFSNDLLTVINDEKYVIQAYSSIQADKEVPLVLKSTASSTFTIKMTDTENIESSQDIFLFDNLLGVYHDLRSGDYNFSADSGEDATRFKIVFQNGEALSNEEFETTIDAISIFINNKQNQLVIKGLTQDIKNLSLINMLGQNVAHFSNINKTQAGNGLQLSNLSTGVYIVDVKLTDGKVFSKKITIN